MKTFLTKKVRGTPGLHKGPPSWIRKVPAGEGVNKVKKEKREATLSQEKGKERVADEKKYPLSAAIQSFPTYAGESFQRRGTEGGRPEGIRQRVMNERTSSKSDNNTQRHLSMRDEGKEKKNLWETGELPRTLGGSGPVCRVVKEEKKIKK